MRALAFRRFRRETSAEPFQAPARRALSRLAPNQSIQGFFQHPKNFLTKASNFDNISKNECFYFKSSKSPYENATNQFGQKLP